MLSDKISRKPRFNTYWELEAVPTGSLMKVEEVIPLPWKHVFSGSGNVPIPSNIFPHSPLILVFWNNRGKTVSTTNTVLKQFLSVWCQMSPSNSMLIIPTSVPSPTSLLSLSAETRYPYLGIQSFMTRWFYCVTFKSSGSRIPNTQISKKKCTNYLHRGTVTATCPGTTKGDQWTGFK